ncbi:MAG: alpha/beta hydrolase-fold protein [Bacteroidia bacterium]|nr:alpha/beta hydrolase-fold protein [Bacteroidia bacterium]
MKQSRFLLITALLIFSISLSAQVNNHHEDQVLYSSHLDEYRGIKISLPSDYDQHNKSYPVLYVLDGEWVFDYAIGCVDFLSNDILGQIPKMIVVGIPNTDRKRDLFVNLESDGSYHRFLNFMEDELIPFVNKKFRTNGFDLIYGWSSGSGICTQLLASRPQLFDGYIESGSGIGRRTEAFLYQELVKQNYDNTYLYVSTEGKSPIRVEGVRRYSMVLDSLKPEGLHYKFEVLDKLAHLDVLSQGLYAGLKYIFSSFQVPEETVLEGTAAIQSYFTQLNKAYAFELEIPVGIFTESASILEQNDQLEEAIKLLQLGIATYPESPNLAGSLGELYEQKQMLPAARTYYQKAMDLSKRNQILLFKYQTLFQQIKDADG